MLSARFAPVFTDHAVLQRRKQIRIWGACSGSEQLQILLLPDTGKPPVFPKTPDQSPIAQAIVAPVDGAFQAQLPPLEAGGPYCLVLLGSNGVYQVLFDVMIGEVWLAGGQSNMEYELQNDGDAKEPDPGRHTCNLRFYQVPRQAYFSEDFKTTEPAGHWMTTDDPAVGSWSAVGFYYGTELSRALDCCVGIIGCNWGGTSASAWQDRESLLSHPETSIYWEEYQELLSGQSPEEYEKERLEYLAYQEIWQPKINEFYAKNPSGSWEDALAYAGPCKWPGPMGPKHEFRPCGLYETMLRRVTPYTLQGFLYYQGESDDHRPDSYHTLLRSLMAAWRRDFQDQELYFLLVQLPMHRYAADPVSDSWARIREAQEKVHREDDHSGLAVIIDLGAFDNIHPIYKKQVGHRLFLQSMTHVYHALSPDEAYGPILEDALSRGNKVLLKFTHACPGFDRERYLSVLQSSHDHGPNALYGFEIAGSDGIYYPATALFQTGDQEILLQTPPQAGSPAAVRYLWTNYSQVPLFDLSGMPVAPFRACVRHE